MMISRYIPILLAVLLFPCVASAGVVVNGDLTMVKDTLADPNRVIYFSNGTSQWYATPWSYNNLDLFYNGGNVGIGKNDPTTALDVVGTITATDFSGNGSGLKNVNASVADGSINTDKIADGAVTNAKITGLISASKIEKYGKVAVVAQSGSDYNEPVTALTTSEVTKWCGSPSATNPCLLKIMPGVYTITKAVVMQPYIDIEGSGEGVTKITAALSSASTPPTTATVMGANSAEIRFLTVENTGTGNETAAILNTFGSPSLLHVTAYAGLGISHNYGIFNYFSSPTMINVTASAPWGTGSNYNYGVMNYSSSPTMTNVTAIGSGGAGGLGILNYSSSTTMNNVTATGLGGTVDNCGICNALSSPTMTNVTAIGSGVNSFGVSSIMGGTIKINHSVIKGAVNTIENGSGVRILVGNTQLDGGPVSNAGMLTCVGAYSGAYTALNNTCQ